MSRSKYVARRGLLHGLAPSSFRTLSNTEPDQLRTVALSLCRVSATQICLPLALRDHLAEYRTFHVGLQTVLGRFFLSLAEHNR